MWLLCKLIAYNIPIIKKLTIWCFETAIAPLTAHVQAKPLSHATGIYILLSVSTPRFLKTLFFSISKTGPPG